MFTGKSKQALMSVTIVLGVALSGSSAVFAQNITHTSSENKPVAKAVRASVLPSSDILIGAAASPFMGNEMVLMKPVHDKATIKIPLHVSAAGFQLAIDGNKAYVPTMSGKTFVINLTTHRVMSSFTSPKGARIASIAKNHQLILTGNSSVTAYSLPSLKKAWQLQIGGNALAIVGNTGYLSGNNMKTTEMINLSTGRKMGSIPVGMIEDSVYDPQHHTLWLANWGNGDMTIVNTTTNKIVKVIQKQEGGGYSMNEMNNMMMATSGYMQMAVGPHGNNIYVASFSSNIMDFNAIKNTFKKDIPTIPMANLSGLAVDPSGQYAYTTVDNMNETIAVSLKSGKVVATYSGIKSYRWFVI